MNRINEITVKGIFAKETENFYRFDLKNRVKGQLYFPKDLKVNILHIELVGGKRKAREKKVSVPDLNLAEIIGGQKNDS
jgi:hypothetical protein